MVHPIDATFVCTYIHSTTKLQTPQALFDRSCEGIDPHVNDGNKSPKHVYILDIVLALRERKQHVFFVVDKYFDPLRLVASFRRRRGTVCSEVFQRMASVYEKQMKRRGGMGREGMRL